MIDLTSLTLAEARSGLASKSFTALELTDAHLEAIEAARVLNAFVMETPDQARAMAREADARIAKGEGGPLAGIPLGIKDLFATKDVRTTAGSKILGNFVPTYESTVTSQLWREGAVMLGKLNDYEAAIGKSVKGMKIGIPREYRLDGMPVEIEKLWSAGAAWLRSAGAELVDISLPHTKYALPAYYIVAPAEASSNLARYDGVRYGLRVPGRSVGEMYENTRAEGFGPEVRRRGMIGTYVLSAGYYDAYYLRAQKVRTLIKKDFEDCFASGVQALLTPATPSAAFGIGEKGGADPVEMYLNDVFTVTVNMAGLPGIAVPAGVDSQGLPLGLQLIGRPFDEETLFSLGQVIEEAAGRFTPQKWWG